ncbi:MAG: acetolactate synthase small subunit [Candidatus Omnitrophica bacterium]|nr:acetolactate synthase small subunit [Candidatus Omnitrophota bacterium]MDD5430394.1 acetolactate synthase small subunit [Candidatus Omnitrophota bacterium]
MNKIASTIIELTVRNHPGAMSHITGLFSRRGFNLEGILCASIGNGENSRMYLLVENNSRLEQIVKQLQKLYDVLKLRIRHDYDHTLFNRLHELIKGEGL